MASHIFLSFLSLREGVALDTNYKREDASDIFLTQVIGVTHVYYVVLPFNVLTPHMPITVSDPHPPLSHISLARSGQAREYVESVFPHCYYDTEPYDKNP